MARVITPEEAKGGRTRDATSLFAQLRHEHKKDLEQQASLKLQAFEKALKESVPASYPGLHACLARVLNVGRDLVYLAQEHSHFCRSCIRVLSAGDVTLYAQTAKDMPVCQRCRLLVTYSENQRHYHAQRDEAMMRAQVLATSYASLMVERATIEKLGTQLEYLVGSLHQPAPQLAPGQVDSTAAILASVNQLEEQLMTHFREFQRLLRLVQEYGARATAEHERQLAEIEAQTGKPVDKLARTLGRPRDVRVCEAVQNTWGAWLKEKLTRFKLSKQATVLMQKDGISHVYVVVSRLGEELQRLRPALLARYGSLFQEMLQIAAKDVIDTVLEAGEKWEAHKARILSEVEEWDRTNPPLLKGAVNEEGILLRKSSQVLRQACAELRASLGHKRPNTLIALERLAARLHEEYAATAHAFASEGEREDGLLTQPAKTAAAKPPLPAPSSSAPFPSPSSSSTPGKAPAPRSSSRSSTASRASILRIKQQLGLPIDDEEEEEGEDGTSPLRSGQQSPVDAFSDDDLSWLNEPATVPVRR